LINIRFAFWLFGAKRLYSKFSPFKAGLFDGDLETEICFIKLLYVGKPVNINLIGGALMEPSKKPLNVLTKRMNTYIMITLKNGVEYRGTMVQCDGFMNILLNGATEHINEKVTANYGNILVRGNNILYITLDTPRK
jgi:small nuclear ribonucleoprotein (snRNP)-like protein